MPKIYQLLTDEIEEFVLQYITEHQLNPHDKLPTERELSTSLNVNRITLRNGLQKLIDKGIIYSHRGKGYFVCPKKHLLPFIRIQRAFVPNFFQKIFSAPLIAQLLRRLYEKILVVAKNPLITSRDKNRSFDSLFSKNSEIFSPFKTSPYLIRR